MKLNKQALKEVGKFWIASGVFFAYTAFISSLVLKYDSGWILGIGLGLPTMLALSCAIYLQSDSVETGKEEYGEKND